jgi:2-polyprenyl-3-methyl-5-hydroxy-6-metoxy-1,4-benzoquinol methylase
MERAEEHCLLCGSSKRSLLFRQGEWSVYRCGGCGLGVLDPRPDPEELNELYRRSYFQSHYDSGLKPESPEMKRRLSQETHRLRFIRSIKKSGRLLDIGCGMGYFLEACRRFGYEAEGMDISADSAAYIREELKIPVAVGTVDEIDYPPASFDVITMWHFFEHAREPLKYLEKAGKWLKPNGILVVDVPNYEGTDAKKMWDSWSGWSLPYHLYHFTPDTLRRLLAKYGFKTIRNKDYLSEYVKERLDRTVILKPFSRMFARFFSGHSYAVVAQKNFVLEKQMHKERDYLSECLRRGEFRYAKLDLPDIDNQTVIDANIPEFLEQETCLFHSSIQESTEYIQMLDGCIRTGMLQRRSFPVVRFADGEYAFYNFSMACNGLYKQAESVAAIRGAMPMHIDVLRKLAEKGKMAPVVFPGNIGNKKQKKKVSFLSSSEKAPTASSFWDFLGHNGIEINGGNYLPFFVVYAYLTSEAFAHAVDGKKLCILNSEYNPEMCRRWFAVFSSRPEIVFTEIPSEYVATRWDKIREDVLWRVPSDTDLCLAGAGVGALMICVDAAERFSIPVIDAGHVLNMMNGREEKSNGARMYTIRKSRRLLSGK